MPEELPPDPYAYHFALRCPKCGFVYILTTKTERFCLEDHTKLEIVGPIHEEVKEVYHRANRTNMAEARVAGYQQTLAEAKLLPPLTKKEPRIIKPPQRKAKKLK